MRRDDPASCPCRADGRRGPAVPHVHVRHDGEAEGHRAHHRRLPHRSRRRRTSYIFDLKPDTDVYWCAADIGWITGHSYIVYGPLRNGATSVMYEGTPDFPDKDRWWEIVERYGVTILYTAPDRDPHVHEVGPEYAAQPRPLVAAAARARWASRSTRRRGSGTASTSAANRTPVVDTWWQTETGMIMITPLPGVTTTKPGSATQPFPGIAAAVVRRAGCGGRRPGGGGYLVLTRAVAVDAARASSVTTQRYRETYWSKYPGTYFAGDGARATPTATSGCWAGSTTS